MQVAHCTAGSSKVTVRCMHAFWSRCSTMSACLPCKPSLLTHHTTPPGHCITVSAVTTRHHPTSRAACPPPLTPCTRHVSQLLRQRLAALQSTGTDERSTDTDERLKATLADLDALLGIKEEPEAQDSKVGNCRRAGLRGAAGVQCCDSVQRRVSVPKWQSASSCVRAWHCRQASVGFKVRV